jgi:hypothetical protein
VTLPLQLLKKFYLAEVRVVDGERDRDERHLDGDEEGFRAQLEGAGAGKEKSKTILLFKT